MSASAISVPSQMEAYLNESGINVILRELVTELCINKPENPVQFMIDFLRNLQEKKREEKKNKGSEDEDDEDMVVDEEEVPPQVRNRERRMAVSSEPAGEVEAIPLYIEPKNEVVQERLDKALRNNILFSHLDASERKEVSKFMHVVSFKAGDVIIEQGDENGDHFYVVDEGECDIYVTKDGVTERVQHVDAGGSFGELALIYNTPRAATVKATVDSKLWAIGRMVYRRVLMDSTIRKREMYESFLDKVPILEPLQKYERLTVADALEPANFKDGEVIVRQGDPGDVFYIIVEGEASVRQKDDSNEEKEIARLHSSEYFGEIALLTNRPRAATVIAIGDIQCVKLDRDRFNRVLGPCEDILRRNMEAYNRYMATQI